MVRVRNCLGWSGWKQIPVSAVNCYDIFPCGRVGQFSIVAKKKDDQTNLLTEALGERLDFEAKLYDLNGNVVKEGKSKGKHRIDWDTSDLKEGQYILRTEFNGKVSSQHVLVNSVCCGGGGC
ncbi:T9SS type A sorting domain-containing protein [Thermoflexibacter ruber]|uniref:T9SS type A sorting domain-containing protein n=1 Tax=Thermoflexibacter ruber TaxID=1003 RepID=UPI000B87434B|nr:T9SS type A sorting domain-containing protein [Thermoflexibacter ruber]